MEEITQKNINMYELLTCLANATDLINPKLANHHHQVAYLAFKLSKELKLSKKEQKQLLLAGLLHDIGALSFSERLGLLETESIKSHEHAYKGAYLLKNYHPLNEIAEIIKYHHVPWKKGEGSVFINQKVPFQSHILHLADRIVISIDRKQEILGQTSKIINNIKKNKNRTFNPDIVDAFLSISNREKIWLDIVNDFLLDIIPTEVTFDTMNLDMNEVIDLSNIFSAIIDFRSPYTATHTAGVAETAKNLAQLAGFAENECKMMLIAGHLHDLGKLAIRNDILEIPGKLDKSQFNIIKSHTYYTYRLLQPIKEFKTINTWAAFHHEKLNGKGYPFHLTDKDIPLGSRIMAVADIFTATTEDRPYRKGMNHEQSINVLKSMVADQSICPYVTSILINNFDLINQKRIKVQQETNVKYINFNDLNTPINRTKA